MSKHNESPAVERVRTAFERRRKVFARSPATAQGTAVTRVRLQDGVTCEIEDGTWELKADFSEKSGGAGEGPDPGVLGRAGLGSCLAIGYSMYAALRGVPLDELTVEIQADYDARGETAVDDSVTPGYLQVRALVSVTSPASEEDVAAVLAEAERYSPWLTIVRDPVPIVVERSISAAD